MSHWDRPWQQCTASEIEISQRDSKDSAEGILIASLFHRYQSVIAKVQEKQRKLGPTSTSTPGFCQVAWASEKKGKQTKLLQS